MNEQPTDRPGRTAAVVGLTAATAAAYGIFLLGRRGGRRRPPTESMMTLPLALRYQRWVKDRHYAYYWRDGEGPPVVLLHPLHPYATIGEMSPLVPLPPPLNRRPVYALEWIGFGHSDRPDVPYVPDLFEAQLEHFLKRCVRSPAVLVAHGPAVGYAAAVAVRDPSLVQATVGLEPFPVSEEVSGIGGGWARLLFTVPGVQRAFFERLAGEHGVRAFYRRTYFGDGPVPDRLVRFAADASDVEGAPRPLDDILRGIAFPSDLCAMLGRVLQPLLLLYGTEPKRRIDPYEELCGLKTAGNRRVERVEGGGMFHWDNPAATQRLISAFLQDATTGDSNR